jgi:hypothetical protein
MLNLKKCMCWCSSIIELKNARSNIEILRIICIKLVLLHTIISRRTVNKTLNLFNSLTNSYSLQTERSEVRIPERARFSLLQNNPHQLWGPISLLLNRHWCSLPGVTRPVREVDYAPPPNTEVKNEWSYTSTPTVRLHGVGRDNFTFMILPPLNATIRVTYNVGKQTKRKYKLWHGPPLAPQSAVTLLRSTFYVT